MVKKFGIGRTFVKAKFSTEVFFLSIKNLQIDSKL